MGKFLNFILVITICGQAAAENTSPVCRSFFNSSNSLAQWEKQVLTTYHEKLNKERGELSQDSWQRMFDKISSGKSSLEDRATFQVAIGLKDIFSSSMIREILAHELQIQTNAKGRKDIEKTLFRFQDAPLEEQMSVVDAVVERLTYLLGHDGSLKKRDDMDKLLNLLQISDSSYRMLQKEWTKYREFNFLPIRWALLIKIHSESSFRKDVADTQSLWNKIKRRFSNKNLHLSLLPPKMEKVSIKDFITSSGSFYKTSDLEVFFEKLLPLGLIRFLEYRGQYLTVNQLSLALDYLKNDFSTSEPIFSTLENRMKELKDLALYFNPNLLRTLQNQYDKLNAIHFRGTLPKSLRDLTSEHLSRTKSFTPESTPERTRAFENLKEKIRQSYKLRMVVSILESISSTLANNQLRLTSAEFGLLSAQVLEVLSGFRISSQINEGLYLLYSHSKKVSLKEEHIKIIHDEIKESFISRYRNGYDVEYAINLLDAKWGYEGKSMNHIPEFNVVSHKILNAAKIYKLYKDTEVISSVEGEKLLEEVSRFSPLIKFKDVNEIILADPDAIYLKEGQKAKATYNDLTDQVDKSIKKDTTKSSTTRSLKAKDHAAKTVEKITQKEKAEKQLKE